MVRKPLADTPTTNRPLRIRLTDRQRQLLDRAAAKTGQATAAWARALLLAAAGR